MSSLPVCFIQQRQAGTSGPPRHSRRGVAALLQTPHEREFREMEQAFYASGGLASTDEVTRMLTLQTDQPISRLARWIVAHELVSLAWNHRTMLPLFQFDLRALAPRQEVVPVVQELATAMTDWETCLWFARPNPWLSNRAPVDCVLVDPRAVHDAARAERYLVHS